MLVVSTGSRYLYTDEQMCSILGIKVKGKTLPVTGHEGPEWKWEVLLYSFLDLGVRWKRVVNATSRSLYP